MTILESWLQYAQDNLPLVIIVAMIALVIFMVAMGFTRHIVFYQNYNDLGVSAGTIALPTFIGFGPGLMLPPKVTLWTCLAVFVLMLIIMIVKTFMANNKSLIKTIFLIPAKLTMSFLFVFYLYDALTNKKRSGRGEAMFNVIVLTPLMLALVKERTGLFRLSRSGRPRF